MILHSLIQNGKKWVGILFLVILPLTFLQAQDYPVQILGYTSGQSVLHRTSAPGDTFTVSFHGGSVVSTKHIAPAFGGSGMAGFKYGLVYAPNAFDKEMFVSKGYFADYIELSWEIQRYQADVTSYKIFRRELGSEQSFNQVANLSGSATNWRDEYAESGVLYEYLLYADGLFPQRIPFLNTLTGIGFRLPSGKVSGRVTFQGGGAVEGVSMIAETDDNFSGSSLYLNGTSSSYLAISPPMNDPLYQFQTAFSFQAWVKPTGTGTATIFQKGTQYKITQSPGSVTFRAGATPVTVSFAQKADTFFNISAVRTPDSLKLYVLYNDGTIYKNAIAFSGSTAPVNDEIFMGKNSTGGESFTGYIDEVRIWNRALPEGEILLKTFLIISGTEDKLVGYYRMNEGVGENFYDLSRKGFTFNEKHGFMSNATWSTVIPLRNQLAVKGVTDVNGNYLITGIPYSSDGSTYKIIPAFGIHTFEPTQRLMFIGPGSNIYSDINFTDVASFRVTGEVFYEGTRFPVEGVQVKIDGRTAVTSAGLPITTDATGAFVIDVPIGKHKLQLEKYGHVFKGGGYFPSATTYYDFQQPFKIQTRFIDSTRIKVIGKIVGGPVQEAKPAGMGKTENNIGKARIILTTQKEWDLKNSVGDSLSAWDNKYYDYKTIGLKKYASTSFKVADLKPKEIEIRPDVETGEYVAYLLPEKYVVKSIVAGNPDGAAPAFPRYTFGGNYLTTLDFSDSFIGHTITDSIIDFTDFTINPSTRDTTYAVFVDSVTYQAKQDFILRLNPTVIMTSSNKNVERFWDASVRAKDGSTISVVSGDAYGQWITPAPIFSQGIEYRTKVSVFEQYVNVDKSNKLDNVPVIDGKVSIQNDLAIKTKKENYKLNSVGELDYIFRGGLPNITTGGIGDFQKSMTVKVFTGKNGSIVSDWPSDGNGFKGYLFGSISTGNNFVTKGPNQVSMIIRDPQGSNSSAFYEVGTSTTTETSYDVENGESVEVNATVNLGQKTITFAGVGAGVILEAEINNDESIGLSQSTNFTSNNTSSTTVTNTSKWSTSSEPDFVGSNGDVFIGNSTNIVYGKCINIELLPSSQCDADAKCVSYGSSTAYQIGLSEGIRISPEFNTGFQFSQNHIENYLIPNLESLRNNFLKKKVLINEYQYVIRPGQNGFGKTNNPDSTTRRADGITGNSYNINYPGGSAWPADSEYVDSVLFYNSQIQNWKNILARNEREKLDAVLVKNYSYDAGTVFESSVSYDTSGSHSDIFQFTINPGVARKKGFDITGKGLELEFKATYNHSETKNTTTGNSTTQTFGFVLNDGDEGDYYSIDVKKPASSTGPVFAVRGGQSQCPYVGAEVSKYHQEGTIISEATMRREVPQISVSQAIVNNVPEGRGANFTLQLKNASETGDDAWFELSVDEASVIGALIQVDGSSIGNGRTFFIPGGSSITKVLTIRQARPDSFNFENVGIILHSLCQFDPGDNWEDISDTIEVSAFFQPACSDILIKNPEDKWLVNTADIEYDGTVVKTIPLNIGIENYDLNHATFKEIAVQYKSSSSSTWITDMKYYVSQADYIAASEPKKWINGASKLNYVFETKSLQDRNYDVRLKTICADGTENFSSIVSGIKDIKRPKLFGSPQPGDGILSPGDDIMVSFDEPIQSGLLTSFNFSVRGVLNGADIAHNSVLFFDGMDDNASVIEGVKLSDKSFTIEFWTQRVNNNAGVIYSQGNVELGFNASNQFYGKFGNQTFTSSGSYTSANDWMHWAISYDYSQRIVSFYMNDQIVLDANSVSSLFTPEGRIYIGQSMTATNNYSGYLHDFRIWETSKGQGSVIASMSVKQRGDEVGLSGYWPMDEATGSIANDLSRSHHAILNGAAWAVFPKGYARTFNGSTDNVTIPAYDLVVTKEMDMTVEFWMKAGPQSNKVIFSNGRGDTDSSPPLENIWVIGSDASGKLYAKNNGTILLVNKNVFDNEWHHVALVVKRIANTTLYVDGNQEAYTQSTQVGGFSGAQLTLGARQFYSSSLYTYDRNFSGMIDEFRFWNLARTTKLIELDKNARLQGNEVGLQAYYPFDVYDVNLVINPSLVNYVDGSLKLAKANGGLATNANVPNIKESRPVQNVDFNWVVNNDKIIINVTETPELIEKTILEITVNDVEDLNENRLASPITWTAYIKKNTVLWNESVINKEKKLYDALTFQVDILNLGGTEQNYIISNLPSWLSVDQASGTMTPDSKKTLTFTISQAANIGKYSQSIYLTSDFGFKEKLDINLKVFAQEPAWTIDESKFEYNMSIIGTLKINDIVSTNADDKIAAFINGELRGVANLKYIPQYDMYEFFLDVYSNTSSADDTIEFKVWNALEGQIHDDVTPELAFETNSIVGSPSSPQQFVVIDNVIVAYPVKKGWNWYSFNVNSPQLNNTNALLKDLSASDGDIIKTMGMYDQYGSGWLNNVVYNLASGYKLKSAVVDTFYVVGSKVETNTVSIPLNTGWNWVGYPSSMNMNINDAMGNVNFSNGDFIKGQSGFALYDQYLGWIGSLKFLKPTLGYMIKTGAAHTLTYPNPELINNSNARMMQETDAPTSDAPWEFDYADYANSMSFIIESNICSQAIDPASDYLGVFVGSECRGYIMPEYIASNNTYLFYLSAYSNTSGEKLTFKYYDASEKQEYVIDESYTFINDGIVGSPSSPFTISVNVGNLCNVTATSAALDSYVKIYPNPFVDGVSMEFKQQPDEETYYTISNVSGIELVRQPANKMKINWDGLSASGDELSSGVYIISIHSKNTVYQVKLIKK